MSETSREPWLLKLVEPEVSRDEPWHDDQLVRKEVAQALTNLVKDQSLPLTISLHGEWGTGKTFLLKRWQQDLENNGFKSIYFNAWEDDFCDDPFVAIIGQLSDSLGEDEFKDVRKNIKNAAKSLIKNSTINFLDKATAGIVDMNGILEQLADKTLDEYSRQSENKEKLKNALKEMSGKVTKKTEQPLIFIIDELDRCRPTFAIELLERVKHIFDIPGMVFVFGINHDELGKAIKSVYGNIDTDTYLRRFFDMNLLLPEADIEKFCKYMIKKYQLEESFVSLGKSAGSIPRWEGLDTFNHHFPHLYNLLDLSLRDIDHCIRSLAFVGKNTMNRGTDMQPFLIGVLIVLRLKAPDLYKKFIRGQRYGADVMDHINEIVFKENKAMLNENITNAMYTLNLIEVDLYAMDGRHGRSSMRELKILLEGNKPTHPDYLSKRTLEIVERKSEAEQARFEDLKDLANGRNWSKPDLKYVSSLIELVPIPNR